MPGDRGSRWIVRLIYLYAFLWVFESAFRKWILPGLSDPLLLIRDPVVLMIYSLAIMGRAFPSKNGFVIWAILLSAFGFMTALLAGHGNVIVATYGVRTMLLHVPLIFIIPRVMDLRHVLFLARATLIVAVPMTVLMVAQSSSSAGSWVNRGLEGVTFYSIGELYRPPGTWSYIGGPNVFYPFAIAAWALTFMHSRKLSLLLLAAGAAIFVVQPVSVSRTLVVSCAFSASIAFLCMFLARVMNGVSLLKIAALALFIGFVVSMTPAFERGQASLAKRLEGAASAEGELGEAIVYRAVEPLFSPLKMVFEVPILGLGIGAGTNVGAKMLVGRRTFLAGENEFDRLMMENGAILGLGWVVFRFLLVISIFLRCWRAARLRNFYPMILFSAVSYPLLASTWAQPMLLGYGCLGGGLILAACRDRCPGQFKGKAGPDAFCRFRSS